MVRKDPKADKDYHKKYYQRNKAKISAKRKIRHAAKGHPLTKIAKDMDISYLSMLAAMKKMPNFKRLQTVVCWVCLERE